MSKRIRRVPLKNQLKKETILSDTDQQAEDMFFQLVAQMAQWEGIAEQLKAENQMKWVGRMNNIRSAAEEIVNTDIIFA